MLRQGLLIKVCQTWGLTALLLTVGLNACRSGGQTDQSTAATPAVPTTNEASTTTSQTNLTASEGVPPLVVATSTVVCKLTKQIAGSTIDLKCLTTQGADLDKQQPRLENSKAIENAKLILYEGNNFAPSLSKLIEATSNLAPKVAVDSNSPQSQESVTNPQASQTLESGIQMAEVINKSLAQLEPSQASLYAAKTQKISNELTQINSWSKSETGANSPTQSKLTATRELMAYLNPSPWPSVNEQARLARVPVMMYHDILPQKKVFFDATPKEFEKDLQLIQKSGVTPISLDQLVTHLRTGLPLPEKPILLTFDDGYGGHYQYVYPLLKKYGYPAVFSIYTLNVGKNTGRTHLTWDQLREMAADPLVTIAAHSVTHPLDLSALSENQLQIEVIQSKRILEDRLGIHIRYFTYPSGKYDERVTYLVRKAGYEAALTMNDLEDRFAGQSKNLLAIDRIGQLRLQYAIAQAKGE